jgi:pimeloyl-ACP methyl ester carboxylesterase
MPVPLPPAAILNLMLLGRFATPGLRVMLRSALAKVQTAVLRSRLRAVVSVDVQAHAKAIDAPVLYLKGIRDRLVPPSSVSDAEQCFRNIRVQAFDAPHCHCKPFRKRPLQWLTSFGTLQHHERVRWCMNSDSRA